MLMLMKPLHCRDEMSRNEITVDIKAHEWFVLKMIDNDNSRPVRVAVVELMSVPLEEIFSSFVWRKQLLLFAVR